MHQCFLRQGLSAFFQRASHRLVADRLDDLEFDEPVGLELHGPAATAFRRLAADQSDEECLLPAVQLCPPAGARLFRESPRQSAFDETPSGALDRGRVDMQRGRNGLVAAAVIGQEQDARSCEFARGRHTLTKQARQAGSLLVRQIDNEALSHHSLLCRREFYPRPSPIQHDPCGAGLGLVAAADHRLAHPEPR